MVRIKGGNMGWFDRKKKEDTKVEDTKSKDTKSKEVEPPAELLIFALIPVACFSWTQPSCIEGVEYLLEQVKGMKKQKIGKSIYDPVGIVYRRTNKEG
jgi:hypothetical protein